MRQPWRVGLDLIHFHEIKVKIRLVTAAVPFLYFAPALLGLRKEHASERARLHNSSNQRP